MKEKMKRGFTLIELLVVVLIIGILAAIALPQYEKAVKRAKLAQVDTIINTAQKAINMYLLENGGFSSNSKLTGRASVSSVTMPGNCDITDNTCYTDIGRIEFYCTDSGWGDGCYLEILCDYKADGALGNNWLGVSGAVISMQKLRPEIAEARGYDPNLNWHVANVSGGIWASQENNQKIQKILCPVITKYNPASTNCNQ